MRKTGKTSTVRISRPKVSGAAPRQRLFRLLDAAAKKRPLWATTLPIIKNDAAAGLSDADYQARRLPLFSAWVTLQSQNASDPKTDEQIGRLIPRILELIDHLYGFPGTPAERRIKERQNKGRTDYLIADIEKQIQALPK